METLLTAILVFFVPVMLIPAVILLTQYLTYKNLFKAGAISVDTNNCDAPQNNYKKLRTKAIGFLLAFIVMSLIVALIVFL